MTHLTRCPLNPARARHLTASPQRLHAAVASAFPPPPSGTAPGHRVLWRLDETRHPHRQSTLLMVSSTPPDLTHVIEQAGWPHHTNPDNPGWDTRPYTPLLEALRPGTRLYFRLTANPTRDVVHPSRRRSVRTALTTPTEQVQWLLDRAPKAGFTIPQRIEQPDQPQLTLTANQMLDFTRTPAEHRSRNVRIRTVTYEGHLHVTDPEALRHALTHGIGRGKAYGCGLLTLARTREPD
ncbi:type I-E CRISPR-associated protein Cas6/Cse3/CasE [Streptomyces sp. NBC_01433]|uniref:type I-E CRISPR-associated protein Cas6/Cse3/CasE n=1 Tax=Streptomyces sp. NBC_01433 TaxID=2903864 RepID=UPI002253F252|nr:type I-E CRISPR-associated protein Cas6/Cse3/CasE [Streptomyces sp. NBC_01433]MCX4681570.1 type I-E CRISPR-associated protein Cas6/Cse3/CasE [Streptomyces sp. NBC_01433]